jgi:hypothetical protein
MLFSNFSLLVDSVRKSNIEAIGAGILIVIINFTIGAYMLETAFYILNFWERTGTEATYTIFVSIKN